MSEQEDTPRRRLEDVVSIAVTQAMTPYRLTLERIDKQLLRLWETVFGEPSTQQLGLVQQLRSMRELLDQLNERDKQRIERDKQRDEDWKRMNAYLDREEEREVVLKAVKKALDRAYGTIKVIAAIAGAIGAVLTLLSLAGVIHL